MIVERPRVLLPRLLDVGLDEVDDAVDERVRQPRLDRRRRARRGPCSRFVPPPFTVAGELDQPLGRVGPAVEDHVLDVLEQILRDVLVDDELAGVDDAHVEAGLDRVVEERRVHRLAHDVVAAERERQVADAAADLHARARRLDDARRLDEVDRVVVVLLEAGGDREDVRIEDDVGRVEAGLLGQQRVRALADRHLALDRVGLALLVERHHDDAGAVAPDDARPCARKSASPSFRLIELTTALPCTHFRPASITDHFELSIMTGTRAISGSVAM